MKANSVIGLSIVILLNIVVLNGATIDHYEGEAYLQTENEIESWTVRDGVIKTGLPWFDELAQQYLISELRLVDISCQVSRFFYHISFDNGYTVEAFCDGFNTKSRSNSSLAGYDSIMVCNARRSIL